MKKRGFTAVCAVLAMLFFCTAFFAGCDNTFDDAKEYTIQYTDDSGTHQITVTSGMPYSLDVIPQKTGYVFTGLYDAEVGGTQYVSANGASVSPFTDKKNMVLFPQFKAKDYTVILDYQGSAVTGGRQFTVPYGSSLPELPKNLTGEHKVFSGWYTKANCEGVQVADAYGLIPVVSVLNDTNFDLSGEYVYLYAGFEGEKFTVTCCFETGMDTEELQIEYGTPVSQIVPKTRVNGNAPLTWSKTQDGEAWNGKVESDMVLYALEYAPVIELDSNGGGKVNPVVARAGATISLPTPTKDMSKFAYWEDMQGNKYTSTTMPSKSISLKAVWQAKLVFDENGGSDVDDISVTAGEKITLPTPEREGFIFAGWYTTEKEQYTSTTMPSTGVKLKAGWYKSKEKTKIVVNSSENIEWNLRYNRSPDAPSADHRCYELDVSDFVSGDALNFSVECHISVKGYNIYQEEMYVAFYSAKEASSKYFINKITVGEFNDTSYSEFKFSSNLCASKNCYMMFYFSANPGATSFVWVNVSDFYFTIHYPDTANLYL